MKLGDIIKEYRDAHDLSQRQFANACGLSNGYISMVEKDENPKTGMPILPSLQALKKIAEGMGISLSSLLNIADDMPVDMRSSQKRLASIPSGNIPKTVGERLKLLRHGMNMTLEDLAETLSVPTNNLRNYEQNDASLPVETVVQISRLFSISTDYLLGLTDNPAPYATLSEMHVSSATTGGMELKKGPAPAATPVFSQELPLPDTLPATKKELEAFVRTILHETLADKD